MSTMEKTSKSSKASALNQLVADRRELVELGKTLSPEEWNTASLCEGWKVRDVIAHIIGGHSDLGTYFTTAPSKTNQKMVDRRKNIPIEALINQLEALLHPIWVEKLVPGYYLYDNWVHQQDIRWVLGPERQREQDQARMQLLLAPMAKKINARKDGKLKYVATDLDWQAGSGQELRGSAEALMLALANRPAAYPRLEGPGVATLIEFRNKKAK